MIRYLDLLQGSILYAGGSTILALVTALPLAVILFKLRCFGRRMLIMLVAASAFVPLHVYASAWLGALASDSLAIAVSGWPPLSTAILIAGWARVPLAVLLLGAVIDIHGAEQEEAAWLETGRRGVLAHVVLPHVLRAMLFPGLILFGFGLVEITVTDLLNVRALAQEVYLDFQLTLDARTVMDRALLNYLPLFALWALIVFSLVRLYSDSFDPGLRRISSVFRSRSRSEGLLATLPAVLLLLLLLGLPVRAIAARIDTWSALAAGLRSVSAEFAHSLWIGAVVATLAAFASTSLMSVLRKSVWHRVVLAIAWMLLLLPGSLLGIALLRILNAGICRGILNTPAIIVLAQFLRVLPLSVLLAAAASSLIPSVVDDMTSADGATTGQSYWHVFLPLLGVQTVCIWLISFAWSLGELDATLIVCPPGLTTLPVRMFTMLHYGVYRDVAAATVLLAVTSMTLVLGAVYFFQTERARGDR
ncbi:MAG: hypothetical protein KJ626_01170 [Verrucomicrobia bacterium]|nr:hypothetical protein [Verrucomicrobiota bacterium]